MEYNEFQSSTHAKLRNAYCFALKRNFSKLLLLGIYILANDEMRAAYRNHKSKSHYSKNKFNINTNASSYHVINNVEVYLHIDLRSTSKSQAF